MHCSHGANSRRFKRVKYKEGEVFYAGSVLFWYLIEVKNEPDAADGIYMSHLLAGGAIAATTSPTFTGCYSFGLL